MCVSLLSFTACSATDLSNKNTKKDTTFEKQQIEEEFKRREENRLREQEEDKRNALAIKNSEASIAVTTEEPTENSEEEEDSWIALYKSKILTKGRQEKNNSTDINSSDIGSYKTEKPDNTGDNILNIANNSKPTINKPENILQKIDNSEESITPSHIEDIEQTENIENTADVEDVEDVEDIEDIEDIEKSPYENISITYTTKNNIEDENIERAFLYIASALGDDYLPKMYMPLSELENCYGVPKNSVEYAYAEVPFLPTDIDFLIGIRAMAGSEEFVENSLNEFYSSTIEHEGTDEKYNSVKVYRNGKYVFVIGTFGNADSVAESSETVDKSLDVLNYLFSSK